MIVQQQRGGGCLNALQQLVKSKEASSNISLHSIFQNLLEPLRTFQKFQVQNGRREALRLRTACYCLLPACVRLPVDVLHERAVVEAALAQDPRHDLQQHQKRTTIDGNTHTHTRARANSSIGTYLIPEERRQEDRQPGEALDDEEEEADAEAEPDVHSL